MKLALIGDCRPHHTEYEIADYIEKRGHTIDRYQWNCLNRRLFLSKSHSYDVVITSVPQLISPQFWSRVKCLKVAWYFDWLKIWGREKTYLPSLKHFDLVISTDGIENDLYTGMNRIWLPHAVDTRHYKPSRGEPSHDVGFIGHPYSGRRIRFLRGLKTRFDFKLMGEHCECWGKNYGVACSMVKIMVGDNFINTVPGYWSDRVYLSLASGAFLLYPRVPLLETHFTDGEHLVFYDDERDLYKKIGYYLPRDAERKQIAEAGMKHCRERHNWNVRLDELEVELENRNCSLYK